MNFSNIRMALIRSEKSPELKAIASVLFQNSIVLTTIKLFENERGLYMLLPRKHGSDLFYFPHPDLRIELEDKLKSLYRSLISKNKEVSSASPA